MASTFGKTAIGSTAALQGTDAKRGNKYTVSVRAAVSKLSIYMDGNGGAGVSQVMRGIIYADVAGYPAALRGVSNEVTVVQGQGAGWVDLVFAAPVILDPGDYWIGVHTGAVTQVSRYFYDDGPAGSRLALADTYSDGATDPFGAGATADTRLISIYATYEPPVGRSVVVPSTVKSLIGKSDALPYTVRRIADFGPGLFWPVYYGHDVDGVGLFALKAAAGAGSRPHEYGTPNFPATLTSKWAGGASDAISISGDQGALPGSVGQHSGLDPDGFGYVRALDIIGNGKRRGAGSTLSGNHDLSNLAGIIQLATLNDADWPKPAVGTSREVWIGECDQLPPWPNQDKNDPGNAVYHVADVTSTLAATFHWYRATAFDVDGKESPASVPQPTRNNLGSPVAIAAQERVEVSVVRVGGAVKYRIYHATGTSVDPTSSWEYFELTGSPLPATKFIHTGQAGSTIDRGGSPPPDTTPLSPKLGQQKILFTDKNSGTKRLTVAAGSSGYGWYPSGSRVQCVLPHRYDNVKLIDLAAYGHTDKRVKLVGDHDILGLTDMVAASVTVAQAGANNDLTIASRIRHSWGNLFRVQVVEGFGVNTGAWNGATAYAVGDVVTQGGVLYKSILAHTNHAPPNATYWTTVELVSVAVQLSGPNPPSNLVGTPFASAGNLATGSYYYRVAAISSVGETFACTEIGPIAVTGPNGRVALAWDAEPGADCYLVYRGTTAGGENQVYVANTNSFNDVGAPTTTRTPCIDPPTITSAVVNAGGAPGKPEGIYYYRITYKKVGYAGGTSKWWQAGNEVRVVVAGAGKKVDLAWTAVPGATAYKIMISPKSQDMETAKQYTPAGTGTTFTDQGQASDTGAGNPENKIGYGRLLTIGIPTGGINANAIVNAVNADATANTLFQASKEGDGTGTVTAFGPTPLVNGSGGRMKVTPDPSAYPTADLNAKHQLAITGGTPTLGQFKLQSYGDQCTGVVLWNSTADQLRAQLETLPSMKGGNALGDHGDMVCTGGPLHLAPITIEWIGKRYGKRPVVPPSVIASGTPLDAGVAACTSLVSGTRRLLALNMLFSMVYQTIVGDEFRGCEFQYTGSAPVDPKQYGSGMVQTTDVPSLVLPSGSPIAHLCPAQVERMGWGISDDDFIKPDDRNVWQRYPSSQPAGGFGGCVEGRMTNILVEYANADGYKVGGNGGSYDDLIDWYTIYMNPGLFGQLTSLHPDIWQPYHGTKVIARHGFIPVVRNGQAFITQQDDQGIHGFVMEDSLLMSGDNRVIEGNWGVRVQSSSRSGARRCVFWKLPFLLGASLDAAVSPRTSAHPVAPVNEDNYFDIGDGLPNATFTGATLASLRLLYTLNAGVQAGNSAALPYNLTGALGKSDALPYALRAFIGKSLVLPDVLRTIIGKSLVEPWTDRALAGKSLAEPYLLSMFLARSDALLYTLRTATGKSLVLPDVLRTAIGRSVVEPYGMRALAGGSLVESYVLNGFGGRSLALPYVLADRPGRSLAQPFTVIAPSGHTLVFPYGLYGPFGETLVMVYGIGGPAPIPSKYNIDAYADGASDPFGSAIPETIDMSIFATYFDPWLPQQQQLYEEEFARLPFGHAQEVLGGTPVLPKTAVPAVLGWHGLGLSPERGSFAVVNQGGKLSGLVGERVRITLAAGGAVQHVYAYVSNEAVLADGEDISLPRRSFLALAPLWKEELDVLVEVMS